MNHIVVAAIVVALFIGVTAYRVRRRIHLGGPKMKTHIATMVLVAFFVCAATVTATALIYLR